jgi:hypothetical protein
MSSPRFAPPLRGSALRTLPDYGGPFPRALSATARQHGGQRRQRDGALFQRAIVEIAWRSAAGGLIRGARFEPIGQADEIPG